MLNQISPARSQPKTEDVVDLLVGCHERIRHFTAVAAKLAHAQGDPPDQLVQAASAVHRYYTVSLPLHEADEETLRPRLDILGDEMLRHALAAMADQHLAIDELLERLLPLLVMVRNNPQTIHAAGSEMCSITQALQEIFGAHLRLEEDHIFPAIRERLAESIRADMLLEMQNRRKQG